MKFYFGLLLALSGSAAGAELVVRDLILNRAVYEDTRGLALPLLERCPPPKCQMVFVGRSPSALQAFVDELYPIRTANIPYNETADLPGHMDFRSLRRPDLSPEMMAHFDLFYTSRSFSEIWAIDHVRHGDGLKTFHRVFEAYLKVRNPTAKLRTLALLEDLYGKGNPFSHTDAFDETIDLWSHYPDYHLRSRRFDAVAKFGSFEDSSVVRHEIRAEYGILRKWLKEQMVGDRKLVTQLRKIDPDHPLVVASRAPAASCWIQRLLRRIKK